MGMTIDTVTKWLGIIRANLKVFPEVSSSKKIEALDTAISYLEDYQQMQLDMLAMLTDIQLEIEEMDSEQGNCDYATSRCIDREKVNDLIQEKINALKEQTDGKQK